MIDMIDMIDMIRWYYRLGQDGRTEEKGEVITWRVGRYRE